MTGAGGRGGTGRQARRHQRGQWWGFAVLVAVAAVPFGFAVWFVVARPSEISAEAGGWLIAFFVALGLLVCGIAWHVWLKIRPPAPKGIELAVTPAELRRGDRVEVALTLSSPVPASSEMEVALICTERYDVEQRVYNPDGPDYDQRVTREDDVHREAVPVDGNRVRASLQVPAGGPFSYEGDCISAVWRVRVLEKRPGRPDRRLDEPVWVLP